MKINRKGNNLATISPPTEDLKSYETSPPPQSNLHHLSTISPIVQQIQSQILLTVLAAKISRFVQTHRSHINGLLLGAVAAFVDFPFVSAVSDLHGAHHRLFNVDGDVEVVGACF